MFGAEEREGPNQIRRSNCTELNTVNTLVGFTNTIVLNYQIIIKKSMRL